MKRFTFRGGIHPPENKEKTAGKKITNISTPVIVAIPLRQHIGATLEPTVKVGDKVKKGQTVGDSEAFISAPVHSSVSGTVLKIEPYFHPSGMSVPAVIIENDGQNEIFGGIKPHGEYFNLSPKEIISIVRNSGIVGVGGATFPTHVKLSPPADKKINYLIINGAECEPYLTSDHSIMLEDADSVIYGLKAMMHILGLKKGYIAIEDNKLDAIEKLSALTKNDSEVEICVLKTKYPQGSEKHLIKAIAGIEVPSGALPSDVGVIVNNVGTCTALTTALKTGMPLVEKIITVSGGGIEKAGNYRVAVGTDFQTVFDFCGGLKEDTKKIIMGGPMMGITQFDLKTPVIKGTSGLLALTKKEAQCEKEAPCVRCGKCVAGCPIGLMPLYLSSFSKKEDFSNMQKYGIMDCVECGSCSFVCPCKKNPVEYIRVGKQKLQMKLAKESKGVK